MTRSSNLRKTLESIEFQRISCKPKLYTKHSGLNLNIFSSTCAQAPTLSTVIKHLLWVGPALNGDIWGPIYCSCPTVQYPVAANCLTVWIWHGLTMCVCWFPTGLKCNCSTPAPGPFPHHFLSFRSFPPQSNYLLPVLFISADCFFLIKSYHFLFGKLSLLGLFPLCF